jgi:hypothetical protein
MAEQNEQEKVEAKEQRPPKPPGWRKFQRLLKDVMAFKKYPIERQEDGGSQKRQPNRF